jgi:PAS domain S-box-containing protein
VKKKSLEKDVASGTSIAECAQEIILESISDGVFTVDHNWRIMSFNRAAEEITGISRNEAIGRYCWEVFRSNMCEANCALKKTMKQGRSYISSSTYIITGSQERLPISVSTALLKDEQGKVLGGVETFRDQRLVEELRRELAGQYQVSDIVSRSKVMSNTLKILPQIAESDSTVLLFRTGPITVLPRLTVAHCRITCWNPNFLVMWPGPSREQRRINQVFFRQHPVARYCSMR